MPEPDYSPSAYEIEKATLKQFLPSDGSVGNTESNKGAISIADNITSIGIIQSINDVSFKVQVQVIDRSNLLETVPLRAEETLELTLLSNDTAERTTLILRVYEISDISYGANMQGTNYTLNCISLTSYDSSTRKITAPWKGKIADGVKFFFDNYFGKVNESDSEDEVLPYDAKRFGIIKEPTRNLTIQDTEGLVDFIIPQYRPGKAMKFMSSRAYNSKTPSQTFRFFERTDGYFFVTDEYFFKQNKDDVINLFYSMATEQATNPELAAKRIDKLKILSAGRNVPEHLYSGAYKNKVLEIDLVRGEVNHIPYDYLNDTKFVDSDGKIVDPTNSPHSREFIEETFTDENAKDMVLFKDYASTGDIPGSIRGEAHFANIAQNRIAYFHHLHDVQLSIETKGRADILPGKVIDLNIQQGSLQSGSESNPQLNGRYLVSHTIHNYSKGQLTTTAKIVKLNWSGTSTTNRTVDTENGGPR